MYRLQLNGYFEVEDPSKFLEELELLNNKHNAYFFGKPVLQDLGHYVDFQKIEESEDVSSNVDNNSETNTETDETV